MANLLIAILAIALIAALSAMALNYGGTIYIGGQADVQATEITAQASKVANALQSWSRANGSRQLSSGAGVDWSNGTPLDLINGSNMYLDTLPKLGVYAHGNGGTDYYFKAMPIAAVEWNNEGGTTANSTNFDSLFAIITAMPVCNSIARLSRGESATPLIIGAGTTVTVTASTPVDFSTVMANSDFDCVYNDTNNNGTLDSGESMFFLYKVF